MKKTMKRKMIKESNSKIIRIGKTIPNPKYNSGCMILDPSGEMTTIDASFERHPSMVVVKEDDQ